MWFYFSEDAAQKESAIDQLAARLSEPRDETDEDKQEKDAEETGV